MAEEFKKQALTDHLADLRRCLVNSVIAVAVGFGIAYAYSKEIGEWLFRPVFAVLPPGSTLIFTSYQEGFFFI